MLGCDGGQQSARGLRVEAEVDPQLVGTVVDREHGGDAIAVLAGTGGHEPGGGGLEGARKQGQGAEIDLDAHARGRGHLRRVTGEAEAGNVGDRVRIDSVQGLGGLVIERRHPTKSGGEMGGVNHLGLGRGGDDTGSEGFGEHQHVARLGARVAPDSVGVDGAGDREAVEQLLTLDRVAAGEHRAGLGKGGKAAAEDLLQGLVAEIGEREADQVHAGERRAAHRPHVGQGVDCRDAAEAEGIIHHRREEVGGVDDRDLVRHPHHAGVVCELDAHQHVL